MFFFFLFPNLYLPANTEHFAHYHHHPHVGISSPLWTIVCFTSMGWASKWCHAHGVIHVTPLSSASFPYRHTSVIYSHRGLLREFVHFSFPRIWGCVCTRVCSFGCGGCRSSCWHVGFSFCLGKCLGVGLLLRTVLCAVQGVQLCEILPNTSQGDCNSLDS